VLAKKNYRIGIGAAGSLKATQVGDTMELSFKQQLELTLIDKAVIGGLLALAGYVFNRSLELFKKAQSIQLEAFKLEQNRKIEEFKSQLATELESRRNVRLAVAELAKRIAAAAHSIAWTTWPAWYCPDSFTSAHLDKYDTEIHVLLSDIVGARVILAALSPRVHGQLSHLTDRLYGLDVDMGEAKALFGQNKPQALVKLANLHEAAGRLDDQLLEVVTKLEIDPLPEKVATA
jgi:hypothetical protein